MSRTRAEAAEQEGGAAPPSPNRRTAKALRANAAEGSAPDVAATSAQLAVANACLEADLARLKEQLREAAVEIQNQGGVRWSSLSAESMRTDREAEKEAKFDVSFLSTFKSSKSLHWLSRQLFEMGFTSVLWDFGPRVEAHEPPEDGVQAGLPQRRQQGGGAVVRAAGRGRQQRAA